MTAALQNARAAATVSQSTKTPAPDHHTQRMLPCRARNTGASSVGDAAMATISATVLPLARKNVSDCGRSTGTIGTVNHLTTVIQPKHIGKDVQITSNKDIPITPTTQITALPPLPYTQPTMYTVARVTYPTAPTLQRPRAPHPPPLLRLQTPNR
jgi:hypothetical protein